ncbi:hypothetical protein [Chryseobacterium sp. Hurlbut01]|uniref:hypothetical protein n=1 Tax=Chryseobacterium sp. Hurlbut01 TaxID=1681828 RepID=UPI00067C2E94|nr:hypothetical protein [Chryseobacterium sp. Hurlbut01]KNB60977.1 hypothetical protein AC804_17695 [Chryseobacterium sp. Hurlbut01]
MEKLKLLFAEINLKEFCERYNLSYDYTRKVFKGTYELSEDTEQKLLSAYKKWLEKKTEIFNS